MPIRHGNEHRLTGSVNVRVSPEIREVELRTSGQIEAAKWQSDPEQQSSGRLNVTLKSTAKPAVLEEYVDLVGVLGSGVRLPACRIRVRGRIVSNFQVTPDEIVFGGRPVGEVVRSSLQVYSLDGSKFQVLRYSVADFQGNEAPKIRRDSGDPEVGSNHSFAITLTVGNMGHRRATLRFLVKPEIGADSETVEVPVQWHGFSPER